MMAAGRGISSRKWGKQIDALDGVFEMGLKCSPTESSI